MRIHLHENARTTPGQHEFIQKNTGMGVSRPAACMGTSDATIRKWQKRASVFDKPHTPEKMNTALDLRQEVAAVCARLSLRFGLDDLLTLVHRFLSADCSRSSLNRCLKQYHISRLPALNTAWPAASVQGGGTCFYYSRFLFPARLFAHTPISLDVMVDSVSRWVCIQATHPPHGPALPFIKEILDHFPIPVSAIIAEQPLSLHNSDSKFRDDSRRHLHMLQQLCRLQGVTCQVCRSMPEKTWAQLEASCRRLRGAGNDMEMRLNGHGNHTREIYTDALSNRLAAALNTYVDMPLKSLKDYTPRQAMMAHYQQFPAKFRTHPDQSCGTLPDVVPPENKSALFLFQIH